MPPTSIDQNDHTDRSNTNGVFISKNNNSSTTSLGVGDIGDANHHTVDTRGMSNSHPTNINASFHQNYHRYPTPNTTIYPRQHQHVLGYRGLVNKIGGLDDNENYKLV